MNVQALAVLVFVDPCQSLAPVIAVTFELPGLLVFKAKPELLVVPSPICFTDSLLLVEEQSTHCFTFSARTFTQSGLSLVSSLLTFPLKK